MGYAVEGDRKDIPRFNSLEEWAERKSTKMDVLARICKHTLSSDRAPPVQFANGQAFFPQIPPLKPGERDTKAIKIAIYQEFPSLGRVLHNVCLLCFLGRFSISSLLFSGAQSLWNQVFIHQRRSHLFSTISDYTHIQNRSRIPCAHLLQCRIRRFEPLYGERDDFSSSFISCSMFLYAHISSSV